MPLWPAAIDLRRDLLGLAAPERRQRRRRDPALDLRRDPRLALRAQRVALGADLAHTLNNAIAFTLLITDVDLSATGSSTVDSCRAPYNSAPHELPHPPRSRIRPLTVSALLDRSAPARLSPQATAPATPSRLADPRRNGAASRRPRRPRVAAQGPRGRPPHGRRQDQRRRHAAALRQGPEGHRDPLPRQEDAKRKTVKVKPKQGRLATASSPTPSA